MASLAEKLRFAFDRLRPLDASERRFVQHNRRYWESNAAGAGGEILAEMCTIASSIIAFSYFVNILARKHDAAIAGYGFQPETLKTKLRDRKLKQLYRSFGVSCFVYLELDKRLGAEKDIVIGKIRKALKDKRDVERLEIDGVWVGDLVYDSHLMTHQVPTIDLSAPSFSETLSSAVDTYLFWNNYLDTHRVKAVVLSHSVYIPAILIRLAVRKGIPCYQVNATHVYYLDQTHIMAYNEHFYYREQFLELPPEIREKGLLEAKARIEKRFSGKVGVDMHYSSKSAYAGHWRERVLKKNDKIKILVAPHCFFDSPHPYGVNLFPDFYEWLEFLGDISERTDYDWYIKTHPDFLPGNIPIINEFISRHSKFTFIPSETSHLQIIDEGIDVALSVYGTIGFEYAALGVPVIYASMCNPCIAYDFNLHPSSIAEFEEILLNLPHLKHTIDIEDVHAFYFLRYIYNVEDWLFGDYNQFLSEIGGYAKQVGSISYAKFLERLDPVVHKSIVEGLLSFIDSRDYCLQRKHMDGVGWGE